VITNKPAAPTERVLRALRLSGFIEAAISPDSADPPFPNKAAAVGFVMQEYCFVGEYTLFIGDARDDARAAHENRLDFAAMTHGYGGAHLNDEFPVRYTCARLSELLEIV